MSLRVLVACEFSGIVRDAFAHRGHFALSCDLLPSETPGHHFRGDVRKILNDGWDLMVAHPPCTYLANSGVRWLHERPERWEQMREGAEFFRALFNAPIPRVAIENPVMHGHAVALVGRKHDQTFQPWHFGHGEVKRVCLWLRGLSPLAPTNIVAGREARVHRMAPSPERQKERSRFFVGIAEAMADQWGRHERRFPPLRTPAQKISEHSGQIPLYGYYDEDKDKGWHAATPVCTGLRVSGFGHP